MSPKELNTDVTGAVVVKLRLRPGMLILGLGLGLECPGLGINNKANLHII